MLPEVTNRCKRGHLWLALLCALLLVGCGGDDEIDITRLPTELTAIDTTLTIERLWRRDVGASIGDRFLRLTPYVTGDTVFVTDVNGRVVALDRESGSPRWTTSVGVEVSGGLNGGDSIVVLGSLDGEVVALDAADGSELWRQSLSSEVTAISSEAQDVIVARTLDGKVHGLDTRSGEAFWQVSRKTPPLSLRGASAPIVANDKLLVGFDNGKLVAMAVDRGTELWEATVAAPRGRSELERMVDIDGKIEVANGIAYVASFQGNIAAMAVADGRVLWSRDLSSYTGLDLEGDRIVATDEEGKVLAFDATNGAALWEQDKLSFRNISSPTVIDDYVVVGDFEGYLHWLSIFDGRFVARTKVGGSAILSPPVVADGYLYALTGNGKLTALAIDSP